MGCGPQSQETHHRLGDEHHLGDWVKGQNPEPLRTPESEPAPEWDSKVVYAHI